MIDIGSRYHAKIVRQNVVLVAIAIVELTLLSSVCHAQQVMMAQQNILVMYVYNGKDEASFKKQVEGQTTMVVDRVAKIVAIDEAQQQKLTLAASGDLSRFYREIEVVREQTKDLDIQKQGDMQKAWSFVQPVRQRVDAGILNETSLFAKVLGSVLTVEQRKVYNEYLRSKDIALYKAILRATISDLEKSLPLTGEQRTKLVELVESKPFPRKVEKNAHAQVGLEMLFRLAESETANILDEHQQKAFVRMKNRVNRQVNGVQW